MIYLLNGKSDTIAEGQNWSKAKGWDARIAIPDGTCIAAEIAADRIPAKASKPGNNRRQNRIRALTFIDDFIDEISWEAFMRKDYAYRRNARKNLHHIAS